MKKKILVGLMSAAFIVPCLTLASGIDESKNDLVYGAALSDSQKAEVDKAVGTKGDENILSVNGSDLEKYLGYSTADSNMISSVYVKRDVEDKGVGVSIKTPANITEITESQYANAAITAGITDADIIVASIKPVTGESALVGVYKAEEARGKDLDTDRTQVAQKELEAVSEVAKENEGKENFDGEKLDTVIIEVKQKLAEHKENEGEKADPSQIVTYIKDALADVDMGDILSNNNIEILVNYFESYQETSAIDSEEVKENLKTLATDLSEKANKFYQDNKETIDEIGKEVEESGILEKLANFFQSIINSIMEAFSSNENDPSN